MKIKTQKLAYEEVLKLPGFTHKKPEKQGRFFRWLLKTLSSMELNSVYFYCEEKHMDFVGKDQPCLFLMNHSSFIDLEIASKILYPRQFHIICTNDGFVGKNGLMRKIGCIPTKKFIYDLTMIKDMVTSIKDLNSSILMFPEASYSFDGTETPLPASLGKCLKLLKVPVVVIKTEGAFARDPLYNNLQKRKVDVSASMECILTPDQIKEKSVEELNEILREHFHYDHWKWQQEKHVKIREPFRADCLNRVLYKCPHCLAEGKMVGKGTALTCNNCGKVYQLTEEGYLEAEDGDSVFTHVPDWYRWERECVRKEISEEHYYLEVPVLIRMLVNTDCVYEVGTGVLYHTKEGFHLIGCEGKLNYKQHPKESYSLYSDYFWYELGDMISIGNTKAQYYCFPLAGKDVVAKTRLAAEELYKLC